ncbi:MAG: PAS domain S-box protein [Alphaproteobacteria bacterium]|nr:MAG: PAS domain S-box protein [Alphaproteobacteria bacterium]
MSGKDTQADAEKRLRATEQYLKDVLDHIPDPIFMKDKEHRWIGGNKAFWELLAGPPEKFLGKSDYDFFPKEEADHFWRIDDRVFAGEVITTEESLTRDGERFVLSTKKASFTSEQQGQFLVGVIRDITQIKKGEEQLRKYTLQLERSNEALEDFAHVASHDLKEPLRGLISQAAFLKEDYRDKLDEPAIGRLNRIMALAKKMDTLIGDLLYFARLGNAELAVSETDMNEIVDDIRSLLAPLLRERRARIDVPAPLPTILCDRTGAAEVLRNLITNAIKYNDKPEKTVEIGYLKSAAAPHGAESDVFYVKDNGIGIDAQYYKDIFLMFRRLQPETDPNIQSGTGAGLTFVKKIIDRSGGRIWLDSEVGKGTTFYFTLGPRARGK